jgi:hypothetical protein
MALSKGTAFILIWSEKLQTEGYQHLSDAAQSSPYVSTIDWAPIFSAVQDQQVIDIAQVSFRRIGRPNTYLTVIGTLRESILCRNLDDQFF